MPTSDVQFKGEWVFINDGLLAVAGMLAREFAEVNGAADDLVELAKSWEKEATFAPPGMINLDLSDWENSENTRRLIEFLKVLSAYVHDFGTHIPSELLMKLLRRAEGDPSSGTWYGNIYADKVENSLAILIELLSKSLDENNS